MAYNITARPRDYHLTAPLRHETRTASLSIGGYLLLNDGSSHLLLNDGASKLIIRGGSEVQSPILTARHRDYHLTAPERE